MTQGRNIEVSIDPTKQGPVAGATPGGLDRPAGLWQAAHAIAVARTVTRRAILPSSSQARRSAESVLARRSSSLSQLGLSEDGLGR